VTPLVAPNHHHTEDLAAAAVVVGADDDAEAAVDADVPVASGERV
jgi:hypothetical protein